MFIFVEILKYMNIDEMIFGIGLAIERGLGCLMYILVLAFFGFIGLVGYIIYDKTGEQTFESKVLVEPDFRIEGNGKVVDTIYIYKFK